MVMIGRDQARGVLGETSNEGCTKTPVSITAGNQLRVFEAPAGQSQHSAGPSIVTFGHGLPSQDPLPKQIENAK